MRLGPLVAVITTIVVATLFTIYVINTYVRSMLGRDPFAASILLMLVLVLYSTFTITTVCRLARRAL